MTGVGWAADTRLPTHIRAVNGPGRHPLSSHLEARGPTRKASVKVALLGVALHLQHAQQTPWLLALAPRLPQP